MLGNSEAEMPRLNSQLFTCSLIRPIKVTESFKISAGAETSPESIFLQCEK